jgi:glycosyltransferase involved in cell wall biosynthesis
VPELIDQGATGWIVDSIDDAAAAVERSRQIERRACRAAFERRFGAERMARDYLTVYQRLSERPGRTCLEERTA